MHPTESAYWRGSLASRSRSREQQKQLGQFMTPAAIAHLMAERLTTGRDWSGRSVRLLDPAAGSGVLAAALVEAVLASNAPPCRIELLLCELDASMLPLLQACARELESLCARHGVDFEWRVQGGDFLLSALARSGHASVDAVIANPPYFKLAGHDERARAFAGAVHGQPNIYALFMASCAALLRPGGAFCFITPRSWTNGAYFRALRAHLLERLAIDGLHLFDSREAHFQADSVLQEALIVWATAGRPQAAVAVSSSHGAGDLDFAKLPLWPHHQVIGAAPERMVTFPDAQAQHDLTGLHLRLHDLGLKVSTGAVVGFRAAAHLRAEKASSTVPMLWMPHVRSMRIDWPRRHRAAHIDANQSSAWMLLPNRPMILLRRFSPKEDARRITAAPYLGDLPGERIGLENHLNVIHPVAGRLSIAAAQGLAAYLNSLPVDRYIRRLLGSTQINALELRYLPVPDLTTLESIGRGLAGAASVDEAVDTARRHGASTRSARHA
ncbi:MAG: Eco57I restriction-modification methylase domain-containing protein [Burkholderiaceae bacterium]